MAGYKCAYPGCTKSYSRKFRLKEHEKMTHDLIVDECTINFSCPFDCGVHAFRTNIQLLSHCDKVHQEQLGKFFRYNIYELICFPSKGLNNLTFSSLREFLYWKEREEEATYSMYIKSQQTYYPSSSGMLYHA